MKQITALLMIGCFLLLFCGCNKNQGQSYLPKSDGSALAELQESITDQERNNYDEIITTEVAVIGSDPEGIAAAVSAARNQMDTHLIDFERNTVGGLYTLGWLNMIDLNYTEKNSTTSINQGIFQEVLEANGNKTSFTTKKMEEIFHNLLGDAKVITKTDYSKEYEVFTTDNTITGIALKDGEKTILLKAVTYIDATQNADIMIDAGAEYYDGLEELGLKGKRGCDTLVFQIKGVDWTTIKDYLQEDGNEHTGADDASAWGYSEIRDCNISDENIYMRGPNIGLQEDGTILLNGLQIFNLDIHSDQAMAEARKRVIYTLEKEIIPFMKSNFAGWENAELADVAPEFYIRESYHLKTTERLVGEDIFQSNFPETTIASGSYPIDLQGREKGLYGIALYGTSPYGIPYGAMVSDKVSNALVASRCAGYDAIAAGSARTVPVGMSLGEAAGVSAAYAVTNQDLDFQALGKEKQQIKEIQDLLTSQGANLTAYPQTTSQKEIAKSEYYKEIKYLRGLGILTCGYSNDYQLKEHATRVTLNSIQYALSSNSPYKVPVISTDIIGEKANITKENIIPILNSFLNSQYTTLEECKEESILTTKSYEAVNTVSNLPNEIFYGVMADLIAYMEKSGDTYHADGYKNES